MSTCGKMLSGQSSSSFFFGGGVLLHGGRLEAILHTSSQPAFSCRGDVGIASLHLTRRLPGITVCTNKRTAFRSFQKQGRKVFFLEGGFDWEDWMLALS